MKQSVCLPIFQSLMPLDRLIGEIADIGFAAVELWGYDDSLETIVRSAKARGLEVCSLTGHASIDEGLNDPKQHDRIEKELVRSVKLCSEYGISGAICFAGSRLAGISDQDGIVNAAHGLARVAPVAEKFGVNLNLELLNSRVDHFNYMGDHTDWCVAVCQFVNSPRVKVLYDIYHAQIMEGDLIRNLTKTIPYLGHVHTGGNPGRAEIDETQEINYRALLLALKASGYQGFVGHEFFPRNEDKLASLRRAFEICNI